LAKVNLVAANSAPLTAYAKIYNSYSFNVGQGCDLSMFSNTSYPLPSDLARILGPKIGYLGALSQSNLDFELLIKLANQLPQAQLVFVGSADESFANSALRQLKNVHFLGLKRPEELPGYIYGFDVCIHPQNISELTTGNFPRKIIEYLAAGKPTIAIKTRSMEQLGDYLFLAESADEFVDQVIYCLNNLGLLQSSEEIEKRRVYAFSNTWDKSAGLIGDAYYSIFEDE